MNLCEALSEFKFEDEKKIMWKNKRRNWILEMCAYQRCECEIERGSGRMRKYKTQER